MLQKRKIAPAPHPNISTLSTKTKLHNIRWPQWGTVINLSYGSTTGCLRSLYDSGPLLPFCLANFYPSWWHTRVRPFDIFTPILTSDHKKSDIVYPLHCSSLYSFDRSRPTTMTNNVHLNACRPYAKSSLISWRNRSSLAVFPIFNMCFYWHLKGFFDPVGPQFERGSKVGADPYRSWPIDSTSGWVIDWMFDQWNHL